MTSKEIIKNKIASLEDDYQHYTMVDKDKVKTHFIKIDIEEHQQILQDLDRLEKFERMFEIMQKHFYVCRGFIEGRITTEKNFKECLKNSWTKYYNGMSVVDDDYEELFNLWNEVLK